MPDHSAEVSLLGCVLLNAAVFGSAWRFVARRVTACRSQGWLDAALLGYAVQYAAIGLPGVVGVLRPAVVVGVALSLSAGLFAAAGRRRAGLSPARGAERAAILALAVFAVVVVVGFAYCQAALPVVSNDALTYHFPAAVQWLQRGRIGLFPTWFFNPANGYSPLAGSAFITWLMVPFGSDVLARYVQVPMLLCAGLGVYRLARQLSAGPVVAAAVGVAAVLCRPLFTASLMGKDDLLVAFTFVAAVVALAPDRAAERFGAVRLGLAVGLLLATKYTALLAGPMLLLAIDGPVRAGWRTGRWATALAVAAVVAGPWYARNWIDTANPVFPLDVSVAGLHLFRGMFTAARSGAMSSFTNDSKIVLGGSYGVPIPLAVVVGIGWLATVARSARQLGRDPLLRACVLGPPIGLALFCWRSPFPEVRFVFPAVLLLFAATAASVQPRLAAARRGGLSAAVLRQSPALQATAKRVCDGIARAGSWAAFALPATAAATMSVSGGWSVVGPLVAVAIVLAVIAAWVDSITRTGPWWRQGLAAVVPVALMGLVAYVRWTAFCRQHAAQWTHDTTVWAWQYPAEQPLWRFVNGHVPADATVAYADLYLVYPLQGATLQRRIGYAPTRRGVRAPADLPWLGGGLSGERLVAAADAATVADSDEWTWRDNLRRLGAAYLVVGRTVAGPEAAWAVADARRFPPLYAGPAGWVFAVRLAD